MPYKITGIDVHKRMLHVVVSDVEVDGEYEFTRRVFGSQPEALRSLATWLVEQEAEEVVTLQILQSSFAQRPQLIAAGGDELPAHAALLDPVAFQNTLHCSPIAPRGQSGHHALPHRSL